MPEAEKSTEIDMPRSEPALRTAEVARALGVSARAVRTWADDGKIACYRTFGGHRLFNVSEVRRVLACWGRPGLAVVNATPAGAVTPADELPLLGHEAAGEERGNAHG